MHQTSLNVAALAAELYAAYTAYLPFTTYLAPIERYRFDAIINTSIKPFRATITDDAATLVSRDAMLAWFLSLPDFGISGVPPTWLAVFQGLHDSGAIGTMAFGMAVRCIYMAYSPPIGSNGDYHTAFLASMRTVPSAALMHESELESFHALPSSVQLYRGAMATTKEQAASGLSWSLNQHYPKLHAYRRKLHRQTAGEHAAPFKLVTAFVPREAILMHKLAKAADREVLVDYEQLDMSTVSELPMPSDGAVLMSAVLNGARGNAGLNGIYRAMALGSL